MSVWPKHWLSLISNRMLIIIMNRLILSLLCVIFLASCGVPEDPLEGQTSGSTGGSSGGDSGGGSDSGGDSDYTVDTSLSAPVSLIAVTGDTQALLKWNVTPNASSYTIYMSESSEITSDSDLSTLEVLVDNLTATQYIIPAGTLTNDVTYYFAVVAKATSIISAATTSGSVSTFSPIKSVVPEDNDVDLSQFTGVKELNDTGTSYAITTSGHEVNCTSGDLVPTQQDCAYGRDVDSQANSDEDGVAGFSFVKVSASGDLLTADSEDWDCVLDNVTGLMWEVKKGADGQSGSAVSSGLHDADDTFAWYDSSLNSKYSGLNPDLGSTTNQDTCYGFVDGSSFCNTEDFKDRVNTAQLCGYSDWRLPTTNELLSIVYHGLSHGSGGSTLVRGDSYLLDTDFFPIGQSSLTDEYWTGSTYFDGSNFAWGVFLRDPTSNGQELGIVTKFSKNSPKGVLLVRSAYE